MSEDMEHALSHHARTCSCPGAQDARRRELMEGLNETEKRIFEYMESLNPTFLLCYNQDYDLVGELIESHSYLRDMNRERTDAEIRFEQRISYLPNWLRVKIVGFIFHSGE